MTATVMKKSEITVDDLALPRTARGATFIRLLRAAETKTESYLRVES
jgi:hypothetical protein